MKHILVVLLIILGGCTAAQLDYPNWVPINPARFPTAVNQIAFPSGLSVSETSGVTLPSGAWTIRFPDDNQVQATNTIQGYIHVAPLRCISASDSTGQDCYLSLNYFRGTTEPYCSLIVGGLPGQRGSATSSYNLTCPDLWTPPA